MQDQIALLQTSDLLSSVPSERLDEIHARLHEVRQVEGSTLFGEGDPGDAVYLVVEGALRLESHGVPLAVRRRGEWVGEMSLVDQRPRSASAIAQTDVVLLRWESKSFHAVVAAHPEVAYGIFKILTRKIRQDIDVRVDLEMEQERWRQDLKRAREIQMGMLPQRDLKASRLEVSSFCRPAAEVGGDYYDFLEFEDDCVGVIIGDVTGHGFYAGLFVAMAKSCLNTQARIDYAPQKVMEAMRHTLSISIQRSLLMTCCYVLLDPNRKQLKFANAGHPPAYHYRSGSRTLHRLSALDPLLGVQDLYDASFGVETRPWAEGDLLVLYSDGITEARDADGRMFEDGRLEKCVLDARDKAPGEIKEAILQALAAHCDGTMYTDDVALVVARAL